MEHMFGFLLICVVSAVVLTIKGTDPPPPPPGHFHPIPSNDSHLLPAINFAAAHVNQYCNCINCQTLVGVTNASEQVVSGAIFVFSINMQESDKCKKEACLVNVSSTDCPPDPKAKPYWCDATVLAKPWEVPPYTLQKLSCQQEDL
ncbi:hypothetical protein BaRGS_00031355 [Batillaria attramentaria]|uniref:Cystatin domain-containing protein n=1 Tax=Batillaria attramentaria TaxID=370345 RepID=A0ABD0JQW1_9CAEN